MSKLIVRERIKQLSDLIMSANEICESENAPYSFIFTIYPSCANILIIDRTGEETKLTGYHLNDLGIPIGDVYDPRFDAAEARIKEIVQEVINDALPVD